MKAESKIDVTMAPRITGLIIISGAEIQLAPRIKILPIFAAYHHLSGVNDKVGDISHDMRLREARRNVMVISTSCDGTFNGSP